MGELEELQGILQGWSPRSCRKNQSKSWLAADGEFSVQKLRDLIEESPSGKQLCGDQMDKTSTEENKCVRVES